MESSSEHSSFNSSPSPSPTSNNPTDKGKRLREEGDHDEEILKNKKMKEEEEAEGRNETIACVFCEGRFSTLSNLLLHLQTDHSSSSDNYNVEQPSSSSSAHQHVQPTLHAFDLNSPIDKPACDGDHVYTINHDDQNQRKPNHTNLPFDLNQLPTPDPDERDN